MDDVEAGTVWFSVIVPDGEAGIGAGTVCIWDQEWNGEPISEIGWMVLPEFQGRGLATEAVRSVLGKARSEGRWDVIHAFPGVTNAPSNAICRQTGFSKVDEVDIESWGGHLRCNHWRIDLRSAAPNQRAYTSRPRDTVSTGRSSRGSGTSSGSAS